MVLAGDPLELRFKMTVGTAQVGGTSPGPRPLQGRGFRPRIQRRILLCAVAALQPAECRSELGAQTNDESVRQSTQDDRVVAGMSEVRCSCAEREARDRTGLPVGVDFHSRDAIVER
jgi:hypothetical protein